MLDRIDIHIEVPRVEYEKLSSDRLGEPSSSVQARVEAARQRQRTRFSSNGSGPAAAEAPLVNAAAIQTNADMRPADVRLHCGLDDSGRALMRTAMNVHTQYALQLSARAYHRILKLARTIADLGGSEKILPQHLAEALQYRPKGLVG